MALAAREHFASIVVCLSSYVGEGVRCRTAACDSKSYGDEIIIFKQNITTRFPFPVSEKPDRRIPVGFYGKVWVKSKNSVPLPPTSKFSIAS